MTWTEFATTSGISVVVGWILGLFSQIILQNRSIVLQRKEEQRKKQDEKEEKLKLTKIQRLIIDYCMKDKDTEYYINDFGDLIYISSYSPNIEREDLLLKKTDIQENLNTLKEKRFIEVTERDGAEISMFKLSDEE